MDRGFLESDWKLFRKRISQWQKNYIAKLNNEYISILSQERAPEENFWELEKTIFKDKIKIGVSIDLRRSTMIVNIIELLNDGVIEIDDLNDFSNILKDTIQTMKPY